MKIYNKYYKRYHARLKVNQIKEPDFKDWKLKALVKRNDCDNGTISPEEYETLNPVEQEFVSTKRTFTDFKKELKVPSKLLPKRIKGGIVLQETTYEMR